MERAAVGLHKAAVVFAAFQGIGGKGAPVAELGPQRVSLIGTLVLGEPHLQPHHDDLLTLVLLEMRSVIGPLIAALDVRQGRAGQTGEKEKGEDELFHARQPMIGGHAPQGD